MNQSTKDFLLDKFKEKTEGVENEAEIREEAYKRLEGGGLKPFKNYCTELEEERGELEFPDIWNFIYTLKDDDAVKSKGETPVKQRLGSGICQALKQRALDEYREETVLKTPKAASTESLQDLTEQIYKDSSGDVKAFVISKQKTLEGRISIELSPTKEKFELLSVLENKDGERFFKHFGQSNPNKGYNVVDRLSYSFYQYKFVSEDEEYLLLTTERVDPQRAEVSGTHISVNDYKTVGENRKLPVDTDIIFMFDYEPAVTKLEEEEVKGIADGREWFMEKLLGKARQPEWVEELLASILMGQNGWPSHLFWMAEPGTGKSLAIDAVRRSMGESETFTGTGSTIKGLTPSFKESPPDEGFLIRSRRVAAVDEKLNLLSNSLQGDGNMKDVFRALLDLLEHKTKTFESGNGRIKGQMDAVMLSNGNPAYKIDNVIELAEKIDQAYLSRMILYQQLPSHVEFIEEQKTRHMGDSDEDLLPEPDDDFISLVDTMREDYDAEINYEKVGEIFEDLKSVVPAAFNEIWRARYRHHITNVLAGLVKLRYVAGERDSLEARPDDYERVRHIFELIVSGWGDVDMDSLSSKAKLSALTHAQRVMYEAVDEEPGISGRELFERTEEVSNQAWCVTKLKEYRLVAVTEDDNGDKRFYPYWTEEAEEAFDLKDQTV